MSWKTFSGSIEKNALKESLVSCHIKQKYRLFKDAIFTWLVNLVKASLHL